MVVRIFDLGRWQQAAVGVPLVVGGGVSQQVRIEVNTPVATRFDVVVGDRVVFLAVVEGLETLDFHCEGPAELVASTDEPWFYAINGDGVGVPDDGRAFVKLMQRKVRNPELELMMYKLEQNAKRREAKQADEIAALRADLAARAAEAAAAGADTETGEVIDEGDGATGAAEEAPATVAAISPVQPVKGASGNGTATA